MFCVSRILLHVCVSRSIINKAEELIYVQDKAKEIGQRMKSRLEHLGMNQKELARKLGITQSTLNGYFTGYREPDIRTIERLSEALEVSVEYLITGRDVAQTSNDFFDTPDEVLRIFLNMKDFSNKDVNDIKNFIELLEIRQKEKKRLDKLTDSEVSSEIMPI